MTFEIEKIRQCDTFEFWINHKNGDALCYKDIKKRNTEICKNCVYDICTTPKMRIVWNPNSKQTLPF